MSVMVSLIRIFGNQNMVMISSKMNRAAVAALQSLTSLSSSHLVKYFVALMIYQAHLCFLGGLIGPKKSIAHLSNVCKVN
jgi:hypothetical protein